MAKATKTTPSRVPAKPAPVTPDAAAKFNTLSPHKSDLAIIAEHPHGLYLFKGKGFATHGAGASGPFLSPATAEALIHAGLCDFEPTGGKDGSIKITDAGREALKAAA